jgi:hypothetical protein
MQEVREGGTGLDQGATAAAHDTLLLCDRSLSHWSQILTLSNPVHRLCGIYFSSGVGLRGNRDLVT